MENKNLQNFQQDLIENDSFIHWVKSEFIENDEYWSSFVDNNMDRMEEINHCIKIVRSLDFVEVHDIDKKALWDRIAESAGLKKDEEKNNIFSISGYKKIFILLAAACVMLLLIFKPGMQSMDVIQTGIAQEIVKTLPDGSDVTINAESSLQYDIKNWSQKRIIQMEGVAFFNVKKGSKFTVVTDKGQVEVLGTSFNVNTRGSKFEVICKTGKVSVADMQSKSNVTLLPGDIAYLDKGELKVKEGESGQVIQIPWLEGVYTFENINFEDVIEELERQFDIKVNLSDQHRLLKYTGFFRKGDLNDAIYSITWPLKLNYRIENKQAFITESSK